MKKITVSHAISLATLLLFSFSLIFLHSQDKNNLYNWKIFNGWLLSFFLTIGLASFGKLQEMLQRLILVIQTERKSLFLILCLAVITRFLLLGQYPYVYMGDGIRDGGLLAMDIQYGNIKDIFGFGSYNGYGLFVPLIASYFLPVFPNSPYAFLVPAALASILAIFLLYLLCVQLFGKRIAIISSLFLISSPFNLHYSRYELLMALDSPLGLLVILSTFASTKFLGGFLLAGLTYGLAFHFYASLRGFAVAGILFLSLYLVRKIIFRKFMIGFSGMFLLASGMIISIGPTLNNIMKNTVLAHSGTQTLIFLTKDFSVLSPSKKISFLFSSYKNALATYIISPIKDNRLRWKTSLLDFPLNWSFIIGIAYCMIKKIPASTHFTTFLFIILLVIPLTNQALINDVNNEHRMQGILPIAYIFSAIGLLFVTKRFPMKAQKAVLFASLVIISLFRLHFYFIDRASETNYFSDPRKEYILQAIVEYIRDDPGNQRHFIVSDKKYNYSFMHYQEKVKFYTFPKQVTIIDEEEIPEELIRLKHIDGQRASFFSSTKLSVQPPGIPRAILGAETIRVECKKKGIFPTYQCPATDSQSYSFLIVRL